MMSSKWNEPNEEEDLELGRTINVKRLNLKFQEEDC